MERTFNAETIKYIGRKVKICGWVNSLRSHGKIIFVDLRDMSGLIQIVFVPDLKSNIKNKKLKTYNSAELLKPEWVIEVIGEVNKRPKGMVNLKLVTGQIEIKAENLKIYSKAKTLPFSIQSDGYEIKEEKRMCYRYLDLRRKRMKRNLIMRQKVIQFMRDFLQEKDFVEVETPILTKSTPEGARDFVVPARLQPGEFYALPQSPQQYKQMLQVAGIERYFQVAKCLRDEDPRADRQAEHTQLDIEMAFVTKEDILNLIERLYVELCKKLFPEKKIAKIPFPRITYQESIKKYKTDKPDIRQNKSNPNELAFLFVTDFPMFEWKKGEKKWGTEHHPFTKPKTDNIEEIKKHPEKILAEQYDFVLNGYEIGGGSLRTTDVEILLCIFEVLGHKRKEIKKQFSHYFEAFSFGVPPHGGIASGIDRFLSIILNEPNIREVIAFPKTGDNQDLMINIPAKISKEQLEELHIKISKKK